MLVAKSETKIRRTNWIHMQKIHLKWNICSHLLRYTFASILIDYKEGCVCLDKLISNLATKQEMLLNHTFNWNLFCSILKFKFRTLIAKCRFLFEFCQERGSLNSYIHGVQCFGKKPKTMAVWSWNGSLNAFTLV